VAPWQRAPAAAAAEALATLTALGATGGLILLDAAGHPGWAFTTPHMGHAWVERDGVIQVGI
jgi:isoaspartyl peptidase/L-asparaginase-like protein (Ntn-hydrolase superfamily)